MFDDTFDIDQLEEDFSANTNADTRWRSVRDLDAESLLEDELQPVVAAEESETDSDGNWLVQGVKRVRRELGKFFGQKTAAESAKPKGAKKQFKRNLNTNANSHGDDTRLNRRSRDHMNRMTDHTKHQTHNNNKKHLKTLGGHHNRPAAGKHNKRSYPEEEFEEGSGHFPDTEGGDEDIGGSSAESDNCKLHLNFIGKDSAYYK